MPFTLKYDSTKVDRSKGPVEPPAPGVYRMVVQSANHVPAKDGSNEYIEIVSRMAENDAEGKGKGYGFWDRVWLTEASAWRLDQWLAAVGIDTEKKAKGSFSDKTFLGKEVRGKVNSDYYNGDYKPKLGFVTAYVAADDDEDLEEDEDEILAEEPEDEDFEEDEDDEEVEEDDEDEEEDEDEADDGLAALDRNALKVILKNEGGTLKVVRSTTDDDIRAAIRAGRVEEEDDEEINYEAMSRDELTAELKNRGLSIKGTSPRS